MAVLRAARRVLPVVVTVWALSASARDQTQIVADIASTAHVSREDAARITNAIIAFMQDLEWRIGYIASSSDPVSQKDAMSRDTIKKCFVSENSEVQVISVKTKIITTQKVRFYFYRLARLRQLYGYTDVQLYFRPDYLGFGRVRRVTDLPSTYEVSVSAVQIFVGKREDIVAYSDITTKKFRVRFTTDPSGLQIKVDEILVGENFEGPELRREP